MDTRRARKDYVWSAWLQQMERVGQGTGASLVCMSTLCTPVRGLYVCRNHISAVSTVLTGISQQRTAHNFIRKLFMHSCSRHSMSVRPLPPRRIFGSRWDPVGFNGLCLLSVCDSDLKRLSVIVAERPAQKLPSFLRPLDLAKTN